MPFKASTTVVLFVLTAACAGPPSSGSRRSEGRLEPSSLVAASVAPGLIRLSGSTRIIESPMLQPGWKAQSAAFKTLRLKAVATASCQAISAEGLDLLRVCVREGAHGRELELHASSSAELFGLGQHFSDQQAHSLRGRKRETGNEFGNRMIEFEGGAVGNTQIPVLFVLAEPHAFVIFADTGYALSWDFSRSPWRLSTHAGAALPTLLIAADKDLATLRERYMSLVGRPPVPPQKAFGFWLSEYGFDDWAELDRKLSAVRDAKFPIDGVVLDLQWFGGIEEDSEQSQMGSLSWNRDAFAQPEKKIETLASEGIGVIAIEESYIAKGLDEHRDLAAREYLVMDAKTGEPVYLDENPWWGKGGMLDWTHPEARDYWHDHKRLPLINDGLVGHWTDLGEPELFSPSGRYHGVDGFGRDQAAVHNFYNLFWARGIAEGYRRHQERRRPFILTRSGTAGVQRFGAAMWSGDIGSNFESLRAHLFAQSHMSFSGIDYYGTDIGGFKRDALRGDLDELYTQWFANAMMFDIPARAHVLNLCNCHKVAPHEVGDIASNRANAELRYELVPYLYSLAHQAYERGVPVIAPLVFGYPRDTTTHQLGTHKLIGSLLAVGVAREGANKEDVYLPAGQWYAWDGSIRVDSAGQWLREVSLRPEGRFRLPLFAQAGSIIPLAHRAGDRGELRRVRIFAGRQKTMFNLAEDDGETIAYQDGQVARTAFWQKSETAEMVVSVAPPTLAGYAPRSGYQLELVGVQDAQQVLVGETPLKKRRNQKELERAQSGWTLRSPFVHVKTGPLMPGETHIVRVATRKAEQAR